MPKKETASEHIKTTLRRHPDFGGRDWKCRPKKGIEGTDAKIVRQSFNNSATGQDVEVLEISGHAHVEQRDGKLFVLTEVTPKAPSPALKPFTTVIDDDPENNAAADQAVQMILDGTTRDQEDEFDRLLDESGPIAWNNRICFAFCTQYGYDTWIIAPISFFEEHGHCPEEMYPHSHKFSVMVVMECSRPLIKIHHHKKSLMSSWLKALFFQKISRTSLILNTMI